MTLLRITAALTALAASQLSVLPIAPMAFAHEQASARYLGNEGVLVREGDTKVLFDAFYNDSYGQYLLWANQRRHACW